MAQTYTLTKSNDAYTYSTVEVLVNGNWTTARLTIATRSTTMCR